MWSQLTIQLQRNHIQLVAQVWQSSRGRESLVVSLEQMGSCSSGRGKGKELRASSPLVKFCGSHEVTMTISCWLDGSCLRLSQLLMMVTCELLPWPFSPGTWHWPAMTRIGMLLRVSTSMFVIMAVTSVGRHHLSLYFCPLVCHGYGKLAQHHCHLFTWTFVMAPAGSGRTFFISTSMSWRNRTSVQERTGWKSVSQPGGCRCNLQS